LSTQLRETGQIPVPLQAAPDYDGCRFGSVGPCHPSLIEAELFSEKSLMLPTSTLLAGASFVSLAAANVAAMLEASRAECSPALKRRLTTLHRVGGYLIVVLLGIMIWVMSARL